MPPAALASLCWPGPPGSFELELELEGVCAPAELLEELELLVGDCACVLAEGLGADAGCGAGDWGLDSVEESPLISDAKLSAAAEEVG